MKRLLLLFALLLPLASMADAWDAMTEPQAKKLKKFLLKNPFILDYCDCCQGSEIALIKVEEVEIIPCSWDKERFSVKVIGEKIGSSALDCIGISKYETQNEGESVEYIATMNYTFGFDKKNDWAVPLFKLVDYSDNHVCRGATEYPLPKTRGGEIIDQAYYDWYIKNIESVD